MSTWVLLRGLTREARHWGGFPDRLEASLPGVRVLTPDLPGCGQRNQVQSPAHLAGIVDSVRADLGASSQGRLHLLGLSLGAMVAVEWASRHPAEISGCVLVNTSTRSFSPFSQRLRPSSYATLLGIILGKGTSIDQEAAILRLTSSRFGAHQGIVPHWAAWRDERPVTRANALRQLAAAARYRVPASPPATPMLVLASQGDRLVDPRCSRELAQRWQHPLEVHPDAGHDLPLDDGDWVAQRVADWIRPT